jgi:hypothetical protein
MRGLLNILLAAAAVISSSDTALSRGKILHVKEIEFRGLDNISKQELFRNVHTEAAAGGISIDITALEKGLASNPLLASHAVELKEKRLIIAVVEKKLLTPLVIKGRGESVLYLLDHEFRKVARNRLYSVRGPLLVVDEKSAGKSGMSDYIKEILSDLDRLRVRKKELYDQISEISVIRDRTADVIMKSRRTRFRIVPDYRSLALLGAVTAYLDRIDSYPESMKIIDDRVFFRPGRKN